MFPTKMHTEVWSTPNPVGATAWIRSDQTLLGYCFLIDKKTSLGEPLYDPYNP